MHIVPAAHPPVAEASRSPAGHVYVVSRMSLIAQAVQAALADRGLALVWRPFPRRGRPRLRMRSADLVLVLDDLETAADLQRVADLVASAPCRFLVLTIAEPGPVWGALLTEPRVSIMSASARLDELDHAVRVLRTGGEVLSAGVRDELLLQWVADLRRDEQLRRRLDRLSPREVTILHRLHAGERVPEIAVALDVAEATVRSQVKSLMRKLGVQSQLAAVAICQHLAEPARQEPDDSHVPRPRRSDP